MCEFKKVYVLPCTAETWPDLLVNEGLASLVEYGCLATVLPQQLGRAGAAAVMRHLAAPHGRAARVHEGEQIAFPAWRGRYLGRPLAA